MADCARNDAAFDCDWIYRQSEPGRGEANRACIHYADEGFIAGTKAVTPRQEIAFESTLANVLAQDLHHAAIGREVNSVLIPATSARNIHAADAIHATPNSYGCPLHRVVLGELNLAQLAVLVGVEHIEVRRHRVVGRYLGFDDLAVLVLV